MARAYQSQTEVKRDAGLRERGHDEMGNAEKHDRIKQPHRTYTTI